MNYLIPEELAQSLLNYLAQRPYGEVFPLVQGLQALREEKVEIKSAKK